MGRFALLPKALTPGTTVVLTEHLTLNLPQIHFLGDLVSLVLGTALLLSVSLHSNFLQSGPQAITLEVSKELVRNTLSQTSQFKNG